MDAQVGDLLAVKLGPRRFGVAHVVWTKPEWGHVSLVVLDGFFDGIPTLAEAKKLAVLEFKHPYYEGAFWIRILNGRKLPPFLSRIGRAPLSRAVRAFPLGETWIDPDQLRRSTSWKAIPATLRREDRYRRDPRYAKEVIGWARPGDVFAFPNDGGFTLCRLFRLAGRVEEDTYAFRRYVDRSHTPGREPPTLDAAMRALARSDDAFMTTEPPPSNALLLGHSPPSKKDTKRRCDTMTRWPEVKAATGTKRAGGTKRATQPKKPKSKSAGLENLTLETVTPRTLFASWKISMPAEEVALARKIVAKLVATLRRAKANADRALAETAIDQAVGALNESGIPIETTEREDLCQLLGALGRSAGLAARGVDARVDRSRDW